jgi:hypothetical protein
MEKLISSELYSEYVKARDEIAKELLLKWVLSEEDDIPFPEITPKYPKLRKFTPSEIFNFEDLFRKAMAVVHRQNIVSLL